MIAQEVLKVAIDPDCFGDFADALLGGLVARPEWSEGWRASLVPTVSKSFEFQEQIQRNLAASGRGRPFSAMSFREVATATWMMHSQKTSTRSAICKCARAVGIGWLN